MSFLFSVMTVVFLRYEQLKTIWGTNNPKKNKVSLALGLLAGIGLSIVANFQVTIQKSMITCHANLIKRGININSSKSLVLFKEQLIVQSFKWVQPRRWRSGLERSPRKRKVGCSYPSAIDLSRKIRQWQLHC